MSHASPLPPDSNEPASSEPTPDPVLIHARRELRLILITFTCFILWSVSFCYFTGYTLPTGEQPMAKTFGMPTWVFWGILVPWLASDVVIAWFCFVYMHDDPLGEDDPEQVEHPDAQPAGGAGQGEESA